MVKNKDHFLSVIIPAYKQASTIRQDLYSIDDTLEQIRYPYEIILVVDGIKVDSTYTEAKKCHLKNLQVVFQVYFQLHSGF